MLLTGLRGVGKTVLLNEIERTASGESYRTISIEAFEGKSLALLLIPQVKKLLFDLDRLAGASNATRRALAVLRSFISSVRVSVDEVSFGLDIEPERGTADSGQLEVDLPNLFAAVAQAAQDKASAVGVFIDELQYFSPEELGALIMAMHRMQQRQLPLVLVGAGLPILPRLAGESKSYAERLFSFPDIGALSAADAARALQEPASAAGVRFTDESLKEVYRLTKGYAYFVQEWGYQSWNVASESPIGLRDVLAATARVLPRLDQNFFRVRFDRLRPAEKEFLRAMAALGPGPHRTSDVAEALGVKITSLGPRRANLIAKGMIFSPAFGDLAFTVPLFDQFMLRSMLD
jgi:hypothetical protein